MKRYILHHKQSSHCKAFSLVELLVTVAVIGIMAMISLSVINKVRDSAKEASARRNAQGLASTSASANAVGAFHVIPDGLPGGGVLGSIDLLNLGIVAENGIYFQYRISSDAALAAEPYLEVKFTGAEFVLAYKGNHSD